MSSGFDKDGQEGHQQEGHQERKRPGNRLHDAAQIPHVLRQEAQARWGVNLEFSTSRADGRYVGQVAVQGDYMAQKVSDRSVVVHRIDQLDLLSNEHLRKRHDENRLSGVHLTIRYEGDRGRPFYYDPQRGAIEDMIHRIKREGLECLGEDGPYFVEALEHVKGHMLDKLRQAKEQSYQQRSQQGTGTGRDQEGQGQGARAAGREAPGAGREARSAATNGDKPNPPRESPQAKHDARARVGEER